MGPQRRSFGWMILRRPTLKRMVRAAPHLVRRRLRGAPGSRVESGHLAYTSFGPGDGEPLTAMAAALLRHEPDARLLVVDDSSGERMPALERDDRVDFAPRWRPRGYPTGLLRLVLESFALIASRYEFDVLLKLDTDALCLRPGVFAEARACFEARPRVGMAGSHLRGTGDERDDHRFAWLVPLMEAEAREDARFAEAWDAALANGYTPGEHVQGGVYVLSRAALDALDAAGLLRWRPRLDATLYDDVVLSMFVYAAGFTLASLEPTILSAPNNLPVQLGAVAELSPAAVHTVKRGLGGESEAEVRAALTRRPRA